jgi:hypothetical protein
MADVRHCEALKAMRQSMDWRHISTKGQAMNCFATLAMTSGGYF